MSFLVEGYFSGGVRKEVVFCEVECLHVEIHFCKSFDQNHILNILFSLARPCSCVGQETVHIENRVDISIHRSMEKWGICERLGDITRIEFEPVHC